jgi:mono/diheme cytochrome c family protein
MEQAQRVFQTNCAACHGQDGRGQGPIAQYFVQARQEPPADLTGARVRGRNDGQLYWLITNGIGNMPNFGNLLSDDERWAMVNVIRAGQGQ